MKPKTNFISYRRQYWHSQIYLNKCKAMRPYLTHMSKRIRLLLSTTTLRSQSLAARIRISCWILCGVWPEREKKLNYIWFNTGVEYKATKEHLKYLEDRYGIQIQRIPAIKSIPVSVREYGQPFLSKLVSEHIYGLQLHDFQWEGAPLDFLQCHYPECAPYHLKWWCNENGYDKTEGGKSGYNICSQAYLKEFMVKNPPKFRISNRCCIYAKKNLSKQYIKQNHVDLMTTGIRKSEGGIRSVKYKTCFDAKDNNANAYRPLFWYIKQDEKDYDQLFDIKHSDCYEIWGFDRTGCVGCPFNKKVEHDVDIACQYESNVRIITNSLFADSYEYTRMYREYAAKRKAEEKAKKAAQADNNTDINANT